MNNLKPNISIELCSGIHEHDMDLMFIEEFCSSTSFTNLFMSKIGETDFQILRIIHSQYEEGNGIDVETQARMVRNENAEIDGRGESDITIIYSSNNKTKALLIEDKINACQQPDQYERYLARGRKAIRNGDYESFEVFLVAPESYYAPEYQHKVTYEEIKTYFDQENSLRSIYKSVLISKALEKKSHSHIIIPAEDVMDFYDSYVRFVKDNHPTLPLKTKANEMRGSKSNWVFYESDIPNVKLIHETLREHISIQIDYGKDNADFKNNMVKQWLDDNMPSLSSLGFSYNPNKSSVSLKLKVKILHTGLSIYEQIDNAEESFEALEKAIAFLRDLRSKGFAEFLSVIK